MLKCLTVLPESARSLSRSWLESVDYQLIRSLPELVEYLRPALEGAVPFGADWETDSLNVWQAQLVGLCLSVSHGTGRYVPVGHHVGQEKNLPLREVIALFKALCEKATPLWAYYRFDGALMRHRLGWEPPAWEDVTLGAYLQYSDAKSFGLKPSALRLLHTELIEFDEVASQGFHQIDPEEGALYGSQDADFTRRLRYEKRVLQALRDQSYIWTLEHKVIPPIMDGIEAGCWADPGRLLHLRAQIGGVRKVKGTYQGTFTGQLKILRDSIYAQLGVPDSFNLDSRQQLGKRLVEIGVPIEERTDKGQIATGEEVLQKYVATHPVMADLTKYVKLGTQDRNYISKLLLAVAYFGPHLRFPFNTIGAPTGRMSAGGEGTAAAAYAKGYVDLNIQSLPDHKKAKYLPNIRSAFVANDPRVDDDEWVIVAIDFCLAPGTRVLTADLRWLPIEEIKAGMRLVALDEHLSKGRARKMRTAAVERTSERVAESYEIVTSDGRRIVASAEHPWLSRHHRYLRHVERPKHYRRHPVGVPRVRQPHPVGTGRGSYFWQKTCDLRVGDRLCKLADPWEVDGSREAGYLAGLFDGEGSINFGNALTTLSQREGLVMTHARRLLAQKGYDFTDPPPRRGGFPGSNDTQQVWMTGVAKAMRFLGSIRPLRLMQGVEALWEGKEVRSARRGRERPKPWRGDAVSVVSVVPVGDRRVISLQTSTGTFVAEGFFTHNSQIELRIGANISREPLWIDAFAKGVDIHQRNAQMAYNDPTITKEDPRRDLSKTAFSFAIFYGAQAATVAAQGGITEAQAETLIAEFLGKARTLSAWIDRTKASVATLGYAKTHFGRRRYLREYFQPGSSRKQRSQGEREAVNHVIQGSGADILKIAIIRVATLLRERGWTDDWIPWAWVHDELVSRVRRRRLAEMLPEVMARMEFPVKGWPVPLKVEAEVGWNWGEMKASTAFSSRYNLQEEKLVSWLSPRETFVLPVDLAVSPAPKKPRKVA